MRAAHREARAPPPAPGSTRRAASGPRVPQGGLGFRVWGSKRFRVLRGLGFKGFRPLTGFGFKGLRVWG